jgi:hypothetical protein
MANKTTDQQESESQNLELQNLANLEWAVSTPYQEHYNLEMVEGGGEVIQDIELTRHEYIALKLHLAKMRGLTIPAKRPAPLAEMRELGFCIEEPIWDEVDSETLQEMGLVTA